VAPDLCVCLAEASRQDECNKSLICTRTLKKLDRAYFEATANQIKILQSGRGRKPDIQIRLHHQKRTAIGKAKPRRKPGQGGTPNFAGSPPREPQLV
jgi:hypothetical protein